MKKISPNPGAYSGSILGNLANGAVKERSAKEETLVGREPTGNQGTTESTPKEQQPNIRCAYALKLGNVLECNSHLNNSLIYMVARGRIEPVVAQWRHADFKSRNEMSRGN